MRIFPKNKFLLCFRPVAHMDAMLESKIAAHSSASSHFLEKKEMMKSSEENPIFFHQGSWIMQHPPKRTICKMIKAVVSQTILKRRTTHKKNYGHGSFGSKKSYKETRTPQSPLSTSSSHGSVSSSSSPQPSYSNNFSNSTKEKQRKVSHGGPQEKQKNIEFYGICLILISLVFTMFCGKLFGIALTSMWLYFFPVWDSMFHCQKRLPTCHRERQNAKSRDRVIGGHNGRFLLQEKFHNGH